MPKPEITQVMYSSKTGEKTGELYQGDRIVRQKTVDYLQDTVELLPDANFVKAYTKPLTQLAKSLTGPEMNMVYYLLQYISYESGALKHHNGQLLTRRFIANEMDLSERTVDRILQGLKAKKVISHNYIGKEVQYYVNPWLFMRGKRINKTLYEMFKNSEWAKVYSISDRPNK